MAIFRHKALFLLINLFGVGSVIKPQEYDIDIPEIPREQSQTTKETLYMGTGLVIPGPGKVTLIYESEATNKKKDDAEKPSWFSRVKDSIGHYAKRGFTATENFAAKNPKSATAIGLGGGALGTYLAYKNIRSVREDIDQKLKDTSEKGTQYYYAFVEKVAPLVFTWEDWQEERVTRGDLVRGLGLAGSVYALKKINDLFDITGKCAPKFYEGKSYAIDFLKQLRDLTTTGLRKAYALVKNNPKRSAALFAGIVALVIVKKLYNECATENKGHRGLISKLWASFTEEQFASLEPALLIDLINQALDNPMVLKVPEFMNILTREQKKLVKQAVKDYAKQMKRVRLAI